MSECGRTWQARRNSRRRTDAIERCLLGGRGRCEVFESSKYAHAASRAARPPATDRRMRDPMPATGFKNGKATRHGDLRAVGIADGDAAPAPFVPVAQHPQKQDSTDQADIAELHVLPDLRQGGRFGRLRRPGRRWAVLDRKTRVEACAQRFVPAGIVDARDGENGDRDRGRQQQGPPGTIPRSEPQPHIDADASMRPHREQQRELTRQAGGRL